MKRVQELEQRYRRLYGRVTMCNGTASIANQNRLEEMRLALLSLGYSPQAVGRLETQAITEATIPMVQHYSIKSFADVY